MNRYERVRRKEERGDGIGLRYAVDRMNHRNRVHEFCVLSVVVRS